MNLDVAIRTSLRRYLSGETTLRAFEGWLMDATEELARNRPELQLRAAINLLIAEYTGGYMSEAELRERLEPFAPGWWQVGQSAATPDDTTITYGRPLKA